MYKYYSVTIEKTNCIYIEKIYYTDDIQKIKDIENNIIGIDEIDETYIQTAKNKGMNIIDLSFVKKIITKQQIKKEEKKEQKIIISEQNKEKIQTMLDDVQKRARVRLVYYEDIINACNYIKRKFNIKKKDLSGCIFSVDIHASTFSRKYKGTPETTIFQLKVENSKWYLIDCTRAECGPIRIKTIVLSDTARDAILKQYMYI